MPPADLWNFLSAILWTTPNDHRKRPSAYQDRRRSRKQQWNAGMGVGHGHAAISVWRISRHGKFGLGHQRVWAIGDLCCQWVDTGDPTSPASRSYFGISAPITQRFSVKRAHNYLEPFLHS